MSYYEDLEKKDMEFLKTLTNEQRRTITRAFSKYVRFTQHQAVTAADIDHSALLMRLLDGAKPLPVAPPKRYSYPDYDLGEGKPVEVQEVWNNAAHWVIDQAIWERRADGKFVWPASGEVFELTYEGNRKILQKVAKV